MNNLIWSLVLTCFCAGIAGAQGALPQLSAYESSAVRPGPADVSAPAPAPEADPSLVVRLESEDIQNSAKLGQVSTDMFEAYMSQSKLFRPLEKVIARVKYRQVLEWTIPFVQSHAKSMELSLREETVAGKKRLVVLSAFEYNGSKVEFLRFRNGNDSSTAARIDGKMEPGTGGKGELLFATGGQADFNNFVDWFEKRLGKPGGRAEGKTRTPAEKQDGPA